MNFYRSIAIYYDQIFTNHKEQANFIKKYIYKHGQNSFLEVGCATGNFCLHLENTYSQLTGIDLDEDMLAIAQKKQKTQIKNINFIKLNMLNIHNNFAEKSFDTIVCLGNTLVHLIKINLITDFIKQTRSLLKRNGTLLLQIINYDYILKYNITKLPLIENNNLKFSRFYKYHEENNIFSFETILTLKKSNKIIRNKVLLYPLTLPILNGILKESGYKKINLFGNFTGNKLSEKSLPLIIKAE